jgi:hypothetical protein
MRREFWLIGAVVAASLAAAEPIVVDPCDDPGAWEIIEADGVSLRVARDAGVDGGALRLDYDFTRGSGFCIVRKEIDLALPANYRFDLWVRGEGPANNLELKLVSPSGDDVWWVNRRGFEPPREWTRLRNRARHFEFAWGPSGGGRLDRVGAIEIAIAAAAGGKGTLWIDGFSFEALQELDTTPVGARAVADAGGERERPLGEVGAGGEVMWRAPAGAHATTLDLVFDQVVEFGAIELEWEEGAAPTRTEILASEDGSTWSTLRDAGSVGGWVHRFFTPETEASRVRVRIPGPRMATALRGVRLVPIAGARDENAYWSGVAAGSGRGSFPAAVLGERSAWTVVGEIGAADEALVSEFGAVEPWKGGPSLEPMVMLEGRVLTWADFEIRQSLVGGELPIPVVVWESPEVTLEQTVLASDGEMLVRYRLGNPSGRAWAGSLAVAARPWQVLPASQWLNIKGGFSRVEAIEAHAAGLTLDGERSLRASPGPSGFVRGSLSSGGIVAALERGASDAEESGVDGPSAAMIFPVRLEPGGAAEIVVAAGGSGVAPVTPSAFADRLASESEGWRNRLTMPRLSVPEPAGELIRSLRTTVGHILINADGPSIQPGSRTYERSWIRDGAMTSAALIATGHADLARAFIDWYGPYQYESGKIPCVVDGRGPDPVDEHDSTGEYIHAVRNVFSATRDLDWLAGHAERVDRGVDYLESLMAQRSGPGYRASPDPLTRAKSGLVPESISHEGYSAKPMHSYWDGFWTLRGLVDAGEIARALGDSERERRYAEIESRFRGDLYASIELAAATHGIDFVPGCVELGDFDATSTSIAVFPVGELGRAPEPLLTNTFERYWRFFVDRRDGVEAWDGMTPYEWRLVGTMVRLGWAERAHAMTDWLMDLRSPTGWNQWGEIAYADDSRSRFVGDMPHTWVGSAFVLSVLSMFVHERGDGLVIAGGIPLSWAQAEGGVEAGGLWTRWGAVGYRMGGDAERVELELAELPRPPGGVFVRLPPGALGATADGAVLRASEDGLARLPDGARVVRFELRR